MLYPLSYEADLKSGGKDKTFLRFSKGFFEKIVPVTMKSPFGERREARAPPMSIFRNYLDALLRLRR
jgi:hypothetical protein